ncbi:MAG: hypothetical protein EXR99_14715 [Gemmataceae bacterium]|nr:hypothetical protein [Gemmataceae bacterium]
MKKIVLVALAGFSLLGSGCWFNRDGQGLFGRRHAKDNPPQPYMHQMQPCAPACQPACAPACPPGCVPAPVVYTP